MTTLTQERKYVRAAGDEPLPGYRLIAPLGMGGFGEVWKCIAPGGLQKAVKFVFEKDAEGDLDTLRQEHEAFERIKGIRHPFLLTLERVELIGGELIMVMELADQSLANRLTDCHEQGLVGIPRDELLSYMVDTAEALDVLGRQHGLQHLDVKPANLFVLGGHVKVGDYGLVSRFQRSLKDKKQENLGRGLTPKYVAPEILHDQIDGRSDQYSLALVYFELLTGGFPYNGKTARQLILQHMSAEPDLSALPFSDQAPVMRALSKDPPQRFPHCLGFVKALMRDSVPALPAALPNIGLEFKPSKHSDSSQASEVVSITVRNTVTQTIGKSGLLISNSSDDFMRACPGWKILEELEYGERGRILRAENVNGRRHRVHLLKLDHGTTVEVHAVASALIPPNPLLMQTVVFPRHGCTVFRIPDETPTLRKVTNMLANPQMRPLMRSEILELIGKLAKNLDALHEQFGFAHGLLSPDTLIYQNESYEISEFGIGELLRRDRAEPSWIGEAPYSAPEMLAGKAVPASDQYSLALIFLELRRAWQPPVKKPGRNERPPTPLSTFDVAEFSKTEREAVRRALVTKPADRHETCSAFVEALREVDDGKIILDEVRLVESVHRLTGKPTPSDIKTPHPEEITDAIFRAIITDQLVGIASPPGASGLIRMTDGRVVSRFPVRLTPDFAKMKLKAFAAQYGYELKEWTGDSFALRPKNVPHLGGTRGNSVELVVELPSTDEHAMSGEVVVTARCTSRDITKHAEQIATVLGNFCRSVKNTEDRRKTPRLRAEIPLMLFPVDEDLIAASCILVKSRDVSRTGISFVSSTAIPTTHAFVSFPNVADQRDWAMLMQIVWKKPMPGGQYLFGAKFVQPSGKA